MVRIAGAGGGWFEGVIVEHQGGSEFHENDHHEDWILPDPELVFMRESLPGHTIQVSRTMMPRV